MQLSKCIYSSPPDLKPQIEKKNSFLLHKKCTLTSEIAPWREGRLASMMLPTDPWWVVLVWSSKEFTLLYQISCLGSNALVQMEGMRLWVWFRTSAGFSTLVLKGASVAEPSKHRHGEEETRLPILHLAFH